MVDIQFNITSRKVVISAVWCGTGTCRLHVGKAVRAGLLRSEVRGQRSGQVSPGQARSARQGKASSILLYVSYPNLPYLTKYKLQYLSYISFEVDEAKMPFAFAFYPNELNLQYEYIWPF